MKKFFNVTSVRPTSPPDYLFTGVLLFLLIFGFVMLSSASSDLAQVRFGDSYYYIKRQLMNGLGIGLFAFLFASSFYYRRWEKLALPILVVSVLFLLLVFTPLGLSAKGATRWLTIGGFSFQPSELLKFSFLLYVSFWASKHEKRLTGFTEGFLPLLILIGAVGLLLIKQPSTTTFVLIFFATFITYFVAGARLRFLFLLLFVGAVGVSTIIYFTPYRLKRVLTFFHPEASDSLGEGYHINQAMTAIGSGGIFGVGYGKSTTKLKYLPEPLGDSIFAVIAEELGFVGSATLLSLFLFLVLRGLLIARKVSHQFAKLFCVSFSSLLGLQVFVHIGAISGVLPLTGVPLPFVSYGGTSLAMFLLMSGVIINISRYRR